MKKQASKDQSSQRALDDLIELVSQMCTAFAKKVASRVIKFDFQLNFIHTKLKLYGADPVLLDQIFGQMTYWICALALNHLMFRKELCNFEKAIQIKYFLQRF